MFRITIVCHARVVCGVSQRSILGPLLFIIYINDTVCHFKLLKYILFADDTTVFCIFAKCSRPSAWYLGVFLKL